MADVDYPAQHGAVLGLSRSGTDDAALLAPDFHSLAARRPTAMAVKRILDVTLSALALILLAPVFAAIGLTIRLTSKGPALFRQARTGKNGEIFTALKFRTMRIEACDPSGVQHTVADDPRVTRFGAFLRRTSLDELPQLWNVLVGDMALVGPRAQVPGMKVLGVAYAEAVPAYARRHVMRPGLTGLAQVLGYRGEVDTLAHARARVDADLAYVAGFSILLDFSIMLRTIPLVLRGQRAV